MRMTIAEKVLSRASGKKHARAGDVVNASPDLYELLDLTLPHYIKTLQENGVDHFRYPERCVVFFDHEVPAQTVRVAAIKKNLRVQLEQLGIRHVYDEGRHGISHQAIVEKGHVLPGSLVLGNDTHVTTLGCVGALGIPLNFEVAQALALGDIWLKVPETIRVILKGAPQPGVMSRDIGQHIIARLGSDLADYRSIEYSGPALGSLDMDARMTICNVAVDVGAKCGVVEPDLVTTQYLKSRTGKTFDLVKSDDGADFAHTLEVELGELEPFIAAPPMPDNLVPISSVLGLPVDQVYIGSCAGGRMEDLRMAASILNGKKVHPKVRMIVVPTSQEIYAMAAREGLLETFVIAGAVVSSPACGPCYGNLAPLTDGEVCIGTGTTNIPGRMGSAKATIYISNAAVASASAIAGSICLPAHL